MLAIHAVMCVPFVHIIFSEISKNDCRTRMIPRQILHININLVFLLKFLIFQTLKFKNFENQIFYLNSTRLCEQKTHLQVSTCTNEDVM